eukprot:scaffold2917_cov191-Amphora_coffeaeformis.AAC.7
MPRGNFEAINNYHNNQDKTALSSMILSDDDSLLATPSSKGAALGAPINTNQSLLSYFTNDYPLSNG